MQCKCGFKNTPDAKRFQEKIDNGKPQNRGKPEENRDSLNYASFPNPKLWQTEADSQVLSIYRDSESRLGGPPQDIHFPQSGEVDPQPASPNQPQTYSAHAPTQKRSCSSQA
jgi:hypothetical protein